MNGLEPRDLPEDRQQTICDTLVADAAARFGYEMKTLPHPTEPLLTKYMYKHSLGCKQTHTDSTSWTIEDKNDSAIEKKAFNDAFDTCDKQQKGLLKIKVENPEFTEMQTTVKVLATARGSLEKQLAEGKNLVASLKAFMEKDAKWKQKHDDAKARTYY